MTGQNAAAFSQRLWKQHPSAAGSGKTITGVITTTVTVGVGGYVSPLSIASTGEIDPAAASAIGLILAAASVTDTIVNSGAIEGGGGAYASAGGAGGTGVDLTSAFIFTNKGIIAGGYGGAGEYTRGAGGTAVEISASGTFMNTGQIDAGYDGFGSRSAGAAGAGVVFNTSATLINSGTIRGGNAHHVGDSETAGIPGGDAIIASREDMVKNTGVIVGGNGGEASLNDGQGGIGVIVEYGSLNNGGTIAGGAAGAGYSRYGGPGGAGVYLLNACGGTNTGVIRGGTGNDGYITGGAGGLGVYVHYYSSFGNTGTIIGGAGGTGNNGAGGFGGTGFAVQAYSTARNAGLIDGGSGGNTAGYYALGGRGGVGVDVYKSSFSNTGKINGGIAGSTPGFKYAASNNNNGAGGDGLDALDGTVTNSGVISGSQGGNDVSNGGTAGAGGLGVSLTGSMLTNTGTIIGGTGGDAPQSEYNNAYGGAGGAGVLVGAGSTLVNDKLIKGGTGGYEIELGDAGGNGVIIAGGVFTNAGTVTEGYGGANARNGPNGDAVFFASAGTLVAAPGAKFIGSVVSTLASGSVLELTGTSSTAFSGLGSQFIGINLISFANGAARVVEGTLATSPQSNYMSAEIAGFAAHDTLILDGFSATPRYTSIQTGSGRIDFRNGSDSDQGVKISNFLAKDLEVTSGGGKTTLTGLGTTATTLASGAAEFVRKGGAATGRIDKNATEEILSGGTVTATTIAGGELDLLIGAKTAGTLSFSGTGGILDIESATMPIATIASFVSGNTIRLDGVAYNADDRVTVGTAGAVTIVAPNISYKLDVAGATKGETDFKFGAGSVLTKTAAAKPSMTFISADTMFATPTQVSWAPDEANPFTLSAFPELLPEANQGLTLFAHHAPGLGYALTDFKAAENVSGPETALILHGGSSFW
jgi:hypothetical protein